MGKKVLETRNKRRKSIKLLVNFQQKMPKIEKNIKKSEIFDHFFQNPVKCEKYAQNHDRSIILNKKNY